MNLNRLVVCVVAVAVAGFAAIPTAAQEAEPAETESVAADSLGEEAVDTSAIEQILRGEREMLEGESFSYDPAGRRYPFRSLR